MPFPHNYCTSSQKYCIFSIKSRVLINTRNVDSLLHNKRMVSIKHQGRGTLSTRGVAHHPPGKSLWPAMAMKLKAYTVYSKLQAGAVAEKTSKEAAVRRIGIDPRRIHGRSVTQTASDNFHVVWIVRLQQTAVSLARLSLTWGGEKVWSTAIHRSLPNTPRIFLGTDHCLTPHKSCETLIGSDDVCGHDVHLCQDNNYSCWQACVNKPWGVCGAWKFGQRDYASVQLWVVHSGFSKIRFWRGNFC